MSGVDTVHSSLHSHKAETSANVKTVRPASVPPPAQAIEPERTHSANNSPSNSRDRESTNSSQSHSSGSEEQKRTSSTDTIELKVGSSGDSSNGASSSAEPAAAGAVPPSRRQGAASATAQTPSAASDAAAARASAEQTQTQSTSVEIHLSPGRPSASLPPSLHMKREVPHHVPPEILSNASATAPCSWQVSEIMHVVRWLAALRSTARQQVGLSPVLSSAKNPKQNCASLFELQRAKQCAFLHICQMAWLVSGDSLTAMKWRDIYSLPRLPKSASLPNPGVTTPKDQRVADFNKHLKSDMTYVAPDPTTHFDSIAQFISAIGCGQELAPVLTQQHAAAWPGAHGQAASLGNSASSAAASAAASSGNRRFGSPQLPGNSAAAAPPPSSLRMRTPSSPRVQSSTSAGQSREMDQALKAYQLMQLQQQHMILQKQNQILRRRLLLQQQQHQQQQQQQSDLQSMQQLMMEAGWQNNAMMNQMPTSPLQMNLMAMQAGLYLPNAPASAAAAAAAAAMNPQMFNMLSNNANMMPHVIPSMPVMPGPMQQGLDSHENSTDVNNNSSSISNRSSNRKSSGSDSNNGHINVVRSSSRKGWPVAQLCNLIGLVERYGKIALSLEMLLQDERGKMLLNAGRSLIAIRNLAQKLYGPSVKAQKWRSHMEFPLLVVGEYPSNDPKAIKAIIMKALGSGAKNESDSRGSTSSSNPGRRARKRRKVISCRSKRK